MSRILIVDDTPSIHQDFLNTLERFSETSADDQQSDELENRLFSSNVTEIQEKTNHSYHLDHAYQGEQAIELFNVALNENRPYDLIFMDVRMPPGIDGIETIRRIREKFPTTEVDFAVCTAFSDYSWQAMLNMIGSPAHVYFIRKPFDRIEILQLALSITESRRLREELEAQHKISAESLKKYEDLFTQSRDGLCHYHLNTEYMKYNPALRKMWGYHQGEDTGDDSRFLERFKKFFNTYFGRYKSGDHKDCVFPIVHFDNSVVWVSMTIEVIDDEQGNAKLANVKVVNVTDQKLREIKEKQSDLVQSRAKAKADLLNHMSHELRTPIHGIIGMCELIKDMTLTELQCEFLDCIDISATSLLQIINNVLDLAKLESGNMAVEQIQFDLYQLIEETTFVFLKKIKEGPIEFFIEVASDVSRIINGDPTKIRQVILNYLSNAFKFTQSGSITLRVYLKKEEQLFFDIIDTGIGMTETQVGKTFRSFSQADESIARKYGGTGLGLAICKNIATLLEGNVSVSSIQSEGSTFSFSTKYRPVHNGIQPSLYECDALLICTEATSSNLKRFLARYGIKCHMAKNAQQLKALAQAEKTVDYKFSIIDYGVIAKETLLLAKFAGEQFHNARHIIVRNDRLPVDQSVMDSLGIRQYQNLDRPITPLKIELLLASIFKKDNISQAMLPNRELPDYKGLKVLVADDNQTNRMVIKGMLNKLHAESCLVENGKEAVDLLQSSNREFHIILLDCEMPVLSGYDAARSIRSLESNYYKTIPIIAFSANTCSQKQSLALQSGMNDFLLKPIRINQLVSILSQWVSEKRL